MPPPSSADKSKHRRRLALLAAVVAVAGGLLSFAGTQLSHTATHRVVAAGATLEHASAHPSSLRSSPPPAPRDVLFVGASYTAGLGANPPTDGYAYVIGREPGWQAQVNGVSGTGFLNPGPRGHQTFADRIAHLPSRPRPQLVIFLGGRNDVNYPPAQLRAAVLRTAALTYKRFGDTQIVILGPIPAHVPAPAAQLAVAATLRSAAASCKAIFIDPIEQGWITPGNENGYTGHVPAHPDNNGYAYIARRLLADLQGDIDHHTNA